MDKDNCRIKTHEVIGATGTRYIFSFLINEDETQLEMRDVTVEGQSISEVLDDTIRQGVFNDCLQKWINIEA
jgi:hypothetical protein